MKEMALILFSLAFPLSSMASTHVEVTSIAPALDIPGRFSFSGETKTLEWGCPIDNEQVEAESQKSALNKLVSQCLEQVSRAAQLKPEVSAVIQASVIAPSLNFSEERKGLHRVNGTIFLETVVSINRVEK